ncbi:hypothetical protein FOCC_FOCC004842 [Frankliniella occidentalis]|nr:hypothetical protein FOCC_FOCC004842 [Frankliniella occidentalis]
MKLALFGCAIGLLLLLTQTAAFPSEPAQDKTSVGGLNHGESDGKVDLHNANVRKRRDVSSSTVAPTSTGKPGPSTTGGPSKSTAKPSGAPISASLSLAVFLTALISRIFV